MSAVGSESLRSEAHRRGVSLWRVRADRGERWAGRADGRASVTVRLPAELHETLKEAAQDRGVSVTWLVNAAIKDYLERLLPADEIRWTR